MDSGIYLSSNYSRFRATPTQSESSSSSDKQSVGDHDGDMSETKITECKQNDLSRKRASNNNQQTYVGDFVSVFQR